MPDEVAEYLLRFEDGPMASKRNIETVAGTSGNLTVSSELFGWPLPERLGVLTHEGVANVAIWDADDPGAAELPDEIVESPNAITYEKVSESQLPENMSHVMRGAQYRLERE